MECDLKCIILIGTVYSFFTNILSCSRSIFSYSYFFDEIFSKLLVLLFTAYDFREQNNKKFELKCIVS